MLHVGSCPDLCGGQGLIRPIVTASDEVVLMCDECGAAWLRPAVIGTEQVVYPNPPRWELAPGVSLEPGTTRWAVPRDVKDLDWDVDWHSS